MDKLKFVISRQESFDRTFAIILWMGGEFAKIGLGRKQPERNNQFWYFKAYKPSLVGDQ
jgi:hypothetical protein